jgi:PAP2 superfamily
MRSEESDALRLFHYNWLVIGCIALALVVSTALAGFSIKPASLLLPVAMAGVYLAAALYNAHRGEKRDPLVIFALGSTGQVVILSMLMAPLTYVAASADFPFQDATLAALDRALGFNWPGYIGFMSSSDTMISGAIFAYSMIRWPVFGIPVALGFAGRYRRLQEFTLALALSLIATTVISALVPAIGIYDEKAISGSHAIFQSPAYLAQLHDLPAVRNGSLRELDLLKLAGIVTFPSFHATSAVIFFWSLWSVWWMRPIAIVSMGAMLVVTPFVGGHYIVDVIAGIAVAVVAIAAARWVGDWVLARKLPDPAVAQAVHSPETEPAIGNASVQEV